MTRPLTARQDLVLPADIEAWEDPFGHTRPSLALLADRGVAGRVSVVMPCYNSAAYLSEAIESVLTQDHPDVELIVVDDASSDDSLAVAQRYGDRATIVSRGARGGACAARNDGLERASGERVLFLDADDYLLPGVLGELLGAAEPGVTVFGEFEALGRKLLPTASSRMRGWGTMEPLEFMLRKGLPLFGPVHERAAVYRAGGFDESLKQAQEKDLHIRLVLEGVVFQATDIVSAVQRMHDSPNRLTNCDWTQTDPLRHLDLSLHWLRLVGARVAPEELPRYRKATADRLLDAARRAVDWDAPDLAHTYLAAITRLFPEYRFGSMAALAGGPGSNLGSRVILGTTAPQRFARTVTTRGKAVAVRLASMIGRGGRREAT